MTEMRPTADGTPPATDNLRGGAVHAIEPPDFLSREIIESEPLALDVCRLINADLKAHDLQIPRVPHLTSRVLEYLDDPNLSTSDILKYIRMDPPLSAKLLEIANSARFAGAEPTFSLNMAIVRLGLRRVSEVAYELSTDIKAFHSRKRGHILTRLWKYSLATGFTCEEMSRHISEPSVQEESAFLTGLLHSVASPPILDAIGKLERAKKTPRLTDAQVHTLLTHLSTPLSGQIVSRWNVPNEVRQAIGLQDKPTRFRRDKPLALLLVCAKLFTADLGIGARNEDVDFLRNRDFRLLRLNDETRLKKIGIKVRRKLSEIWKS